MKQISERRAVTTDQLTLVVQASPAGGEGKTTLSKVLEAQWLMNGRPVQMLCGDAGNRAAKVADASALTVDWASGSDKARAIFDRVQGSNVIFDLGANAIASGREIGDLILEMQEVFAEADYRTFALFAVGTNKIGAAEAAVRQDRRLPGFTSYFVRVNRDRSANVVGTLPANRTVELGHLAPGFIAALEHHRTWDSAIARPVAGYTQAADHIAAWMRRFGRQEIVRDILGLDPVPALDALRPPVPLQSTLLPLTLETASDEVLTDFDVRAHVLQALADEGFTPAALRSVADRLETGRLF